MSDFDKKFSDLEKIVITNGEEFNKATGELRPDRPKWKCWENLSRSNERIELTNYARLTGATIKEILTCKFHMMMKLGYMKALDKEEIARNLTLTYIYLHKTNPKETFDQTYEQFLGKLDQHREKHGSKTSRGVLFQRGISEIMVIAARETYQQQEKKNVGSFQPSGPEIMRG
jgi:hypothetical protein